MADPARPEAPVHRLQLSRPFESVLLVLSSLGTVWIFVLMIVICLDVIGRTVFTAPLPGVPELVKLSIVAIVFLQIGATLRAGRITRVDALRDWLVQRSPRGAAALGLFHNLVGIVVFAVLLYACWPIFRRAWEENLYVGIEGYITYPTWPVYLILLIGCACSAIQFALFAWSEARGVARDRLTVQTLPSGGDAAP